MDKNPVRVQFAPKDKSPRPTPLVLIHDGCGTTFGYFSLGKLHRDVWAIHNPNFFTAKPWEGGINEMARHYIGLIESVAISGRILIGGWSLGGYLAIEIARILADQPSPKFSIAGILLADTPFHLSQDLPDGECDEPDLAHLPDLVLKSLDICGDMLEDWELPLWGGPALCGRPVRLSVGFGQTFDIEDGSILHKSLEEFWRCVPSEPFTNPSEQDGGKPDESDAPPPAVLLRCVEYAPTVMGSDKVASVDMYRDQLFLGWDGSYPNFIKACLDTGSHHYNLFDFKHINELTREFNQALEILEVLKDA